MADGEKQQNKNFYVGMLGRDEMFRGGCCKYDTV
jgi:hypothetical protein